jgi:sensor domain DACNV-containing protein
VANSTLDLARSVNAKLEREKARLNKIKSIWPITSEIPGVNLLLKLFDVVYYTSLKAEVGRPVVTRLCLVNPDKPEDSPPPMPRLSRWQIVPLAVRLPLTVAALVKIAKAADPWTSALAVFFDKRDQPYIWGLIDQTVHWNRMLVREGSGYDPPGLFNIASTGVADLSVYRGTSLLARLRQDTLLETENDVFWHGPVSDRLAQWTKLFRRRIRKQITPSIYDSQHDVVFMCNDLWIASLCRILIHIQRYRHGGALLITNRNQDLFPHYTVSYDRLPKHLLQMAIGNIRTSIAFDAIQEMTEFRGRRTVPTKAYIEEILAKGEVEDLEESLTGTVHFISSLSCVDGLVLMRPDLTVTGYGVEIRTSMEVNTVRLSLAPDISPETSRLIESNHYGTRHRSMMRYCYSQPSSLGFVVSQDGDIRALMRVGGEVVMWDNLKIRSVWFENWTSARSRKEKAGSIRGDVK